MFDNYLSSEMTGCLGAWDTFEARVAARADEGVVIAYQGTCDGLVAAAYLLHTLRGHGVDVPQSHIMWVSTEDHEYVHLRSFIRQQRPAFLITLGLSVQSSSETIAELVESVGQRIFVFDHHAAREHESYDQLVVVNPTPTPELAKTKPMPPSLFGYLCAERAGRDTAPWLVGVALLDEGVEEQMTFFYEELSRLHDLPSPGMVGGSSGLRQTIYGRISRLLASSYAARESDQISLELVKQVLNNQLPGPDELLDAASEKLARLANTVTTEVRRHIDVWRQRISAYLSEEPFVKVEVPSDFTVASPVASILQSHFPDKIVVIYTKRGGSAHIEIRAPKDGPDVIDALHAVAGDVAVHCYSGQKSAASATIDGELLDVALDKISAHLDPNWEEDDEE